MTPTSSGFFSIQKLAHDLQIMLVLVIASIVSVQLRHIDNSLLLYLPTAFGIIAIHWFGPRVLYLVYANGILTLFLWGAKGDLFRYALIASHEPAVTFASWLLAGRFTKDTCAFSNVNSFIGFVILGIAVPGLVNCFYTYHYSFVNGDLLQVALLWLADFITSYSIAVPAIHFFKLDAQNALLKIRVNEDGGFTLLRKQIKEAILLTIFFIVLNLLIDFKQYWFVYGICCCIIAVRRGFHVTVATNFILFSLSYVIPLVLGTVGIKFLQPSSQMMSVHIGMTTMFFVSAIIGRAISDYKAKEKELTKQKKQLELINAELKKTNSDLDRFVYSVSHDISAPLKSIRGLIALFKMEGENASVPFYIDKIHESVVKLENFTGEVLEHSRSSRKEVKLEPVELKPFFEDILENLKYVRGFEKIKFNFELEVAAINTDRFLLKVAASNILSNAIKYQKRFNGHAPEVKIKSLQQEKRFEIQFEDNGEGIRDEIKGKVFEMFYRASAQSSGSGLGLYIARESIEKLKGSLSLDSKFGEGSSFRIILPSNN